MAVLAQVELNTLYVVIRVELSTLSVLPQGAQHCLYCHKELSTVSVLPQVELSGLEEGLVK